MADLTTSENAGGRFKRKRVPLRVDLTAMVDLAFLLITFFMLTTTLAKKRAQPIAMPDEFVDAAPTPASRTMTVCLGTHNEALWFMGTADDPITKPQLVNYSKEGLRKILVSKRSEITARTGKDLIVIVKPSNHSVYENLVNTIDELNISKIDRYAITDITSKEIGLLKYQQAY